MRFLVDVNVWFELLHERAQKEDVVRMLQAAPRRILATTDFAIHTVGVVVAKSQPAIFLSFLEDLIQNEVGVIHVPPPTYRRIVEVMSALALDFDDALHYVAAERDDLTLVSLDADFDRTPRGRKTPAQVLADLRSAS